MSHDLAHPTGLSKPPGYNLKWPHVIPIQVALVTGPQQSIASRPPSKVV